MAWQMENTSMGLLVLAISFGFFYFIGWYSSRLAKSSTDYWTAGRSIGAVSNGLGMASTFMSLATFMGVTALILNLKVPFIYMWMQFALAIPMITLLYGTSLRRMEAYTPAHFIRERYGVSASIIIALFLILIMLMYSLGQMIGVAKVFEMLLGIPYEYALFIGGFLIVGYVTIGGMYGASYNAAFQMVLMALTFIIPLGAIMKAMGSSGWWFPPLAYADMVPAMLEAVPDFFDLQHGVKWYFALIPAFTLGQMGLPHLAMRVFTSPSLQSARSAVLWFAFFSGLMFSATYTMGFAGVFFQASTGTTISATDADKITLILNMAYNPEWVLALVIAGAIAAGLSTISGNLMAIGALVAQDIIGVFKPNLPDKTQRIIGYVALASGGIASVLLAYKPPAFLVVSILWAFGLAASTSAPLVLTGVWWKEANKYGAIVGSLGGGLAYIITSPYVFPNIVLGSGLTANLGMASALFAAPLCFFLLITVSMITNRIPSLAKSIPMDETKRLIDRIHGWADYKEERYNSTGGAISIASICVVMMVWALMPW